MARAIEKGATYLDKLCHKLYDEPKGRGFRVDGKCCRCGGPLMTYYCEDRLHLIVCEKCGTLALTKAVAPQVAANLTLGQPTITQPNEPLTLEQLREMEGQWIIIKAFDADISGIMPAFIKDQFATTLCELGSKAIVPDLCEVHFSFNEYGKTWIAYRRPKEEQ